PQPSVGFGSISEPSSDRAAFSRDLLEDIMPFAEKLYRISAKPDSRAIAGLSMGGGQSISIGLNHLELFHSIGIFSAGIARTGEGDQSSLTSSPTHKPPTRRSKLFGSESA